MVRGNSGGIGRGFDSSSVSVVTPAPTLPAGTGGSYFAGTLGSAAPPMRRGSSGEGGGSSAGKSTIGMHTPTNLAETSSRLADWTAVGAAVHGVQMGNDETPTRPSAPRAQSSAMSNQSTKSRDRDGSNGSVTMVRKTVGDFTVGETLGEGSYSTVSRPVLPFVAPTADPPCAQVSLVTDKHPPNRCYALKVLDKDHIKREKKTKYVLIERDTLKTLDGHPGIVRLYWTFQDQRSLCASALTRPVRSMVLLTTSSHLDYVLELAKNGELLKWIKKVRTAVGPLDSAIADPAIRTRSLAPSASPRRASTPLKFSAPSSTCTARASFIATSSRRSESSVHLAVDSELTLRRGATVSYSTTRCASRLPTLVRPSSCRPPRTKRMRVSSDAERRSTATLTW